MQQKTNKDWMNVLESEHRQWAWMVIVGHNCPCIFKTRQSKGIVLVSYSEKTPENVAQPPEEASWGWNPCDSVNPPLLSLFLSSWQATIPNSTAYSTIMHWQKTLVDELLMLSPNLAWGLMIQQHHLVIKPGTTCSRECQLNIMNFRATA